MRAFWSNTPTWRLLRALLLAAFVFVALVGLLGPWPAALVAIALGALSWADATRNGPSVGDRGPRRQ